jgi:hypothetical protein
MEEFYRNRAIWHLSRKADARQFAERLLSDDEFGARASNRMDEARVRNAGA